MSLLLQVLDSTNVSTVVEDGHAEIGIAMNLMKVLIASIVLVGGLLLLRYYLKDKRRKGQP
jgi:hypothetical protein